MCITYTLGGFDLHQPEIGFRLLDATTFASEVSPRRVHILIPRMHGEVPAWNDPLDAILLALRVEVRGEDAQSLEQRWTYLRALCRLGSNQPVEVRRESDDGVTSTFAQLQTMEEPTYFSPVHKAQSTMLFHIPSGRWQDITAEEQQLAIPGAEQPVVVASESSAPITDALVRAEGPLTSLTVMDDTSQTGFTWSGPTPVSAGQYLLINCADFTAWVNSDDEWTTRNTNVSRWLGTTGNGMLSLVPDPGFIIGSATSSVTVNALGTSGDSDLHILARRTYI